MTWRVYVVYDKSAWLVVPFAILNVVSFASATLLVNVWSGASAKSLTVFFVGNVHRYSLMFLSVTVATQACGSILIAWRGWSTPVLVSSSPRRRGFMTLHVIGVIIDSGAIYLSTFGIGLGLYLGKNAGGSVVIAIVGQISATVPLSIILRDWWKLTYYKESTPRHIPGLPLKTIITDNCQSQGSMTPLESGISSGDGSMVVRIIKSTHRKIDDELLESREDKRDGSLLRQEIDL